jgi:N-acetylglucosamine malate deacetylase 1
MGSPLPSIPHLYYCDPIEGKDALGSRVVPGFCVSFTEAVMSLKTAMLECHASQRDWLHKHHGMDQYTLSMRGFGIQRGQEAGREFAEGFRQHLGHSYPQDNILLALLESRPA